MKPEQNKQVALRKAINAHEEAEASLADLTSDASDAKHLRLLERVRQNLAELQAEADRSDPEETV